MRNVDRGQARETTLLELSGELLALLEDDRLAVRTLSDLLNGGWLRTRDGRRLALEAAPSSASCASR